MDNKAIVEYFKALSQGDRELVLQSLLEHLTAQESTPTSKREEAIKQTGLSCPACSSKEVVGYGLYRDRKRYKCRSCNKTFNTLTGTVAHHLHKKQMLREYVYYMLQGYSLRKIATEMDICLKTAFDWRHKVLGGLSSIEKLSIKGVVEADETFFLFSEKGNKKIQNRKPRKRGGLATTKGIQKDHVAVLTAYERGTSLSYNTVLGRGRITKLSIERSMGVWLNKSDCILCTDSHKTFEGFALDNHIKHKRIFARRNEHVVEKLYHIQHVNSIHSKLKRWMLKFNGVSTKYLQNYMNYFNLVKQLEHSLNQAEHALETIMQPNMAYVKRSAINQQHCIT